MKKRWMRDLVEQTKTKNYNRHHIKTHKKTHEQKPILLLFNWPVSWETVEFPWANLFDGGALRGKGGATSKNDVYVSFCLCSLTYILDSATSWK